jgi:hypothetical protein
MFYIIPHQLVFPVRNLPADYGPIWDNYMIVALFKVQKYGRLENQLLRKNFYPMQGLLIAGAVIMVE